MPGLRFRGLAATNPNFPELLHEHMGYRAQRDGVDWIVPENDSVLRAGPPNIFTIHGQRPLDPQKFNDLAKYLAERVPNDFEKYQPSPPSEVRLTSEYGLLSKIEGISTRLAISSRPEIADILAKDALPFMREKLSARFVTPVTINASKQQTFISIAKVVLLNEFFGSQKTSALIFAQEALKGILPNSLDYLSYLEALTRLSPYAFTLPIRRLGCMWH